MKALLLAAAILFLISCDPYVPEFPDGAVQGMRPVYRDSSQFVIRLAASRPLLRAGKIYSYGDFLLINEVEEGIHVVDNSDPAHPQTIYFIEVPGNTDMAIKDGKLYVNNFSDLVALEVSATEFREISRFKNLFLEEGFEDHPPQSDVYFECVDSEKGELIGWEVTILEAPECYKR